MSQTAVEFSIAETARAPGRKLSWLGVALGVWISLYPFFDLALRPRTPLVATDAGGQIPMSPILLSAYIGILATGILPILYGAITLGVDFRRAGLLGLSVIPLCISIPLSLLSSSDLQSLQYILSFYYVSLCVIILISISADHEVLLRSFLSATALTLALAMTWALIDHDFVWGRLFGRMAPNYWGGLALTSILASMAIRSWYLRIPVIAVSLIVIGCSESRGEMAALAATLSLTAVLFARAPRAQRWTWLWFVAALGAIAAVVLGSDFIANNVLRLSDKYRGLDSGFTGRVEGWREAQDLFLNHPWLGVGYQQHSQYMTSKLHNAYLAMLADTGVIGFVGYMIFIIGALLRSVTRAWNNPIGVNLATAALLFAYAAISLVEPFGIHTGDTAAMLMIFMTAWAWRTDPSAAENLNARKIHPAR
jgi:O-antigen ligase